VSLTTTTIIGVHIHTPRQGVTYPAGQTGSVGTPAASPILGPGFGSGAASAELGSLGVLLLLLPEPPLLLLLLPEPVVLLLLHWFGTTLAKSGLTMNDRTPI
jgi:hypothetical protein